MSWLHALWPRHGVLCCVMPCCAMLSAVARGRAMAHPVVSVGPSPLHLHPPTSPATTQKKYVCIPNRLALTPILAVCWYVFVKPTLCGLQHCYYKVRAARPGVHRQLQAGGHIHCVCDDDNTSICSVLSAAAALCACSLVRCPPPTSSWLEQLLMAIMQPLSGEQVSAAAAAAAAHYRPGMVLAA